MKFLFVATTMLIASTQSFSQVQFGVFGGPQATTARYKIGEKKQETEMKFGFQLGGTLKVPFENKLFFSPAAFYSMKGYKVKFTEASIPPDANAIDNNTTIHTFEMAFLLQYDFNGGPGFFMKLGPSLDFQIMGNEKFNLNNNTSVDRKMKFSFEDSYGWFGANAIVQLGYETSSGFMIFAHYSHGIGSINNHDGGPSINHTAFGISIGKYFGGKKIIIDTRNKE